MEEREIGKAVFFWTLVALFFITSSLIIFYSFGFRYNSERGIFIYGGSVTLKTSPQEVKVSINGENMTTKRLNRLNNSYHIDGIRPGNYLLEVSAPGFKSWSKHISVHSGVSTEFWNIILVENEYTKEEYGASDIGRFFISPNKNLAAFTKQQADALTVSVLNPQSFEIAQLFSFSGYRFTDDDKENMEWTPQAHRIIIPALNRDNEKEYLITTVETKEVLNLKDIVRTENLSQVRWDPDNRNALYFVSENNLFRVDLDESDRITKIAENIATYDISAKGLYYLRLAEGSIFETNFTGTSNPLQVTSNAPEGGVNSNYRMIVYDESRIVLINYKTGELYVFNRGIRDIYFVKLATNAKGAQFSNDGKKLLYWTDNEINTYFVREWDTQPLRSENERTMVTRFAEPVRNVQWSRDFEHILFTHANAIKVIELDRRDHYIIEDVLSLNDPSTLLVSNSADGRLYFTERSTDGSINLFSIFFPEEATILNQFAN